MLTKSKAFRHSFFENIHFSFARKTTSIAKIQAKTVKVKEQESYEPIDLKKRAAWTRSEFEGLPIKTKSEPQTFDDLYFKLKTTKFQHPTQLLDFYEKNRNLFDNMEIFH